MQVSADIIIFAVIAAVLIGRLWSVMGQRDDDEPKRPHPFAPRPDEEAKPDDRDAPFAGKPFSGPEVARDPNAPPPSPLLRAPAPPAGSLAAGLAEVQTAIPDFDEKAFLHHARQSFTAIVEAYAVGSLSGVQTLLSPPLLAVFQKTADARRAEGQVAQTRVRRIVDADVIKASAQNGKALLTVKFISEQENTIRNASGTLIGGIEGRAEEITDIWVFARDSSPAEAAWMVVETQS